MINGTGTGVGNTLSAHPDVDMISFTGSTRTELGGKSAAVMLDDADLPKLMPQFMGQLMNNTGQSCNALSRMLVPRPKYEEAVQIAKTVAEGTKPGRSRRPKR